MALHARTRPSAQAKKRQPQHRPAPAPLSQIAPQSLSTETFQAQDVVQLQRLVGNRATQRLLSPRPARPVIQRVFETKDVFLGKTDALNVELQAIGDSMNAFNLFLAIPEKTPENYQNAFTLIKQLDRRIHTWLNNASAAHAKLTDAPHFAAVEAVRQQSQIEHGELVDAIKGTAILPFDMTGMGFEEQMQLTALWTSIKSGAGKLQLVGDPANKKAMLSDLYKLLDTPTGRKLLGFLNAGDPEEAMTNIYIGQAKAQLPGPVRTAATKVTDSARSEAHPLIAERPGTGAPTTTADYEGPKALDGTENPAEFPTAATADDFREATISGKKGVIFNGQKYLFRRDKGVGSLVHVHEGGVSQSEDVNHHQITTPRFVTLGHELGHAAHMRAGGTAMNTGEIGQGMSGLPQDQFDDTWQNSEELLTIQGWENAVRGDVGLTARGSHIPYTAGKKIQRKYVLLGMVRASFTNRDKLFLQLTPIQEFTRDFQRSISRLDDDGVYDPLRLRLVGLQATVTDDQLVAWKRKKLRDDFALLRTRWKAKWFVGGTNKREYRAIKQEVRTNEAAYTRVQADSPFQGMIDRIGDLSRQFR